MRSVNGSGLEMRTRVPYGLEALEPRVREMCAARLGRGSVNVTLAWQRTQAATAIRLNEAALADVAKALEIAGRHVKAAPPTLDGILGLKGVLEAVETPESEAEGEARTAAMLAGFGRALDELVAARQREGDRLAKVLGEQIAETARLAERLDTAPERAPERVMARLTEAIARLRQASSELDAERLHQEAMLIATRVDITEERARLKSHGVEARTLNAETEPGGRRPDIAA